MIKSSPRPSGSTGGSQHPDAFAPGSMVIVTMGNPREKFWGMILALSPQGLSVKGIELASVEDLAIMVKDGEPFSPSVVFFPMHRIERIELDLPDGNLPSLSQRFSARTGLDPSAMLRTSTINGANTATVLRKKQSSGEAPA